MSAIFNQNIRSFSSDAFLNAVKLPQPAAWVTSTAYVIGNIVVYSNQKYIASSSGTSGPTPPTHTSGVASDGAVNWIWVNAMPVGESYSGNLYAFIGKNDEWDDELVPDAPELTDLYDYEVNNNMISLKKITINDMRLGIARTDWTSGTVYDQYDSTKDVLQDYTHPFYVMTDESHIYKCLNNNNGATSTSKPTGTVTTPINTIDGYSWKYMATMSSFDSSEFLTTDFIPVEYKTYNDLSKQWDAQVAAKVKSISTFDVNKQVGTFTTPVVAITTTSTGTGAAASATKTGGNAINQILISDCGQNYERDGTFAIVTETGAAGSGATATATVAGGIITLITVNLPGSGYTGGAVVLITGEGTGATATATIAIDDTVQTIAVDLGGTGYVAATTKVHIIPGDCGAVGIPIMAPIKGHSHNIISELRAFAAIINVRLAQSTHFLTGVDSDFRQIGILTDLLTSAGLPASDQYYIGPSHPEFTDGGSVLNKIRANSGNLLYVSNIQPAVRSVNQEERIKIAIVF